MSYALLIGLRKNNLRSTINLYWVLLTQVYLEKVEIPVCPIWIRKVTVP
jgi:hypothetical protein